MTTFDANAGNNTGPSADAQTTHLKPDSVNTTSAPTLRLKNIARGSGRPLASVVKPLPEDSDVQPAAHHLGVQFRTTREAQEKTLDQAARAVLISRRQVEALENGHWHLLPEPVYVTGAIKRYANWLGLNANQAVADYRAQAQPAEPTIFALPEAVTKEKTGFARFAMAASLVAMVGLGYGVWSVSTDTARQWAETTPPVPDRLATLVEQLPQENNAYSSGVDEANAAIQPEIPYAATSIPSPQPQVSPQVSRLDHTFSTPSVAAIAADGAVARVVLRAREDSWIQIEGDDAELIVTRVLRAGEEYAVPARDDLIMITGNAGGIEVLLDGKSLGLLGKRGDIRRDVSLSADALASEKAAKAQR
ncbi:MAG: helix-turn-helix domain-containing protein [Alphaproteobacteria bacterium]